MRRGLSFLAAFVVLVVVRTLGADPGGDGILGIWPGMPSDQATAELRKQGYPVAATASQITARTRDGMLIATIDGTVVREIRYSFTARRPGEPETIRASIVDRLGPPNATSPMIWCQSARLATCLEDDATVVFDEKTMTLTFRLPAQADSGRP